MSGDPAASRPLFVPSGNEGVLARATDTGGTLGLVETEIPAGHSTPLHVHRREDEAFYVLSGTVDFVCGDQRFRADSGAFVLLPRGIPHTFLGVSQQPSHVLVLLLPGGLEDAFANPSRFHEILRARRVELVGPPLACATATTGSSAAAASGSTAPAASRSPA